MKRKALASSSGGGYGDDPPQREDRFSSLPDALLVYILSLIDTKLAVQCSVLSKRWINLWTLLPVLNFDSSFFVERPDFGLKLPVDKGPFDHFIDHVLQSRNRAIKLDTVNLRVTSRRTMAMVLHYALSNGVRSLSIDTSKNLSKHHPILCLLTSDSLTSFTLKGMLSFGRFPEFVGLVSLRLERVKIICSDPFSCFPNLENLALVNCKLPPDMSVLEVIAFRLTNFTISSCFYHPVPYEKLVLYTPKLVFFEIEGLIPMSFETVELPALDTIHIDCCFTYPRRDDGIRQPAADEQKLNLLNILRCLGNAKSVHLSPSTVKLLSLSHAMLVDEPCPFGNLQLLNLIPPPNKPVDKLDSVMSPYLLKDCSRVELKSFPR